MKTVVCGLVAALAISTPAYSKDFDDSEMLGAAVLGAFIGNAWSNSNRTRVYQPVQPVQPVYPPEYYYPEREYYVPHTMYRDIDVWIPECGCYRTIRVRVK